METSTKILCHLFHTVEQEEEQNTALPHTSVDLKFFRGTSHSPDLAMSSSVQVLDDLYQLLGYSLFLQDSCHGLLIDGVVSLGQVYKT